MRTPGATAKVRAIAAARAQAHAAHALLHAEEHDYDGGERIDGEFYAATKRQRRHQSKEARRERRCRVAPVPALTLALCLQEQLYGVFAEGESDSEERQARRRGAGGAAQQGAAFAKKPVAFVSSGVVGGDPQPPPPPPRQQAPARDDMDTDDAPRGGLGLGASAGGSNARPGLGASSGLGFVSGSAQVRCVASSERLLAADVASRLAQEEEDDALPSAFGQRLKEAADARRREADAKARRDAQGGAGIGAPRARGGASARQPAAPAPGATFEAHTRGIGSKLLEKMGYKAGQGLGREGTGIAEAIQTKLRPKNMGMGYNEYQEQTRLPADAEVAEPEAPGRAAPGAAAPAPAKGGWKRRAKEARQKRVYKTAEELLRESEVRCLMRGAALRVHAAHALTACAGGRAPHDGGGHARNARKVRGLPSRLHTRELRALTRSRAFAES
jgi:tuftelin-interacting protein 11